MKVKLTLLETKTESHAMRTKSMIGQMLHVPHLGERLVIYGRGLEDRKLTRKLETSPIVAKAVMLESSLMIFVTQNSTYTVKKLSK